MQETKIPMIKLMCTGSKLELWGRVVGTPVSVPFDGSLTDLTV